MPSNNFHENPGDSTPTNQNPQNPGQTHPTDYPSPEQQHIERLSQEVQELKLSSQSDARNRHREVSHLRRRLGVLTGIFIAVIVVLGGTVAWLGSNFKAERAERDQLAEQLRSANKDRQVGVEQIANLRDQINSLQEKARSLSQQAPKTINRELREIQDRLKDLETEIREIATSADRRQQVIDALERALGNSNNQEQPPTPAKPDPNLSGKPNNSN